MDHTICIGYDSPHPDAFSVCRFSLRRRMSRAVPITGIHLDDVRGRGLYSRPMERRTIDGRDMLWDPISEAPMATEFACSRFLAPFLAGWKGWAWFMDCDMLSLRDFAQCLDMADPRYAVMCVHHKYAPTSGTKMDGRAQLGEVDSRAAGRYTRKLWSSMMGFNCEHPSNAALTLTLINGAAGRDLHRFCWLKDHEIGEIPADWNFIAGHSDPQISPALVHYTEGGPWLKGFDDVPFSREWLAERQLWIRGDMI